jgi:hypothetical protein
MHSVGSHNKRGAAWLSVDKYPYDASILTQRTIHMRSRESNHARHASRRAEQHVIEVLPSLAAARDGQAGCLRKSSLSDMLSEVVAHAVEWGASDCLAHPEAVQNGNTCRHQSFAARFLFGKVAALEELHLQAASSKQNRKRGTCNAATGNKNVSHGYEANGHKRARKPPP